MNGAGKSTILSCIKDILGIQLNEFETKKIGGNVISLSIKNIADSFSNITGHRLIDSVASDQVSCFADYNQAIDIMDFFKKNKNLEELLEQYDDNNMPKEIVDELSYIVGKEYAKCILIEIDDEEVRPYFRVTTNGIEYDSINMGVGEHFLFYLHWLVSKIENEKILIIEEPETFVSINSQIKLMNYLAKISCEKGISIVVSTHSPFIVQNIQRQNICIVNRLGPDATTTYPHVHETTLHKLGMQLKKRGIIYLEDFVAQAFAISLILNNGMEYILYDYNFEIVDGYAEITKRLKFPISVKFEFDIIGIYDGDVKSTIEAQNDIVCKHIFLPCENSVELELRNMLNTEIARFCSELRIDNRKMIESISEVAGVEDHDWLIQLASKLNVEIRALIDVFCRIWMDNEGNKEKLDIFIKDLSEVCEYN